MANWFITGGFGFIGSRLANAVASNPENRVRIFDNLSVGSKEAVSFNIAHRLFAEADEGPWENSYTIGDIKNFDEVKTASTGADVIVHLAANTGVQSSISNPKFDCETNVIGTLNVLEACRCNDISKFIFASSGAPLGGQIPPLHEEMPAKPISPYGASKLAGEGYCQAYAAAFGITTVILRFGNVYGPGSMKKESVVSKFIKKGLKELPIQIYGNGRQTRDYIFVDDLITAIHLSAATQLNGANIYQIATSKETSILELVTHIKSVLKDYRGIDLQVDFTDPITGDAIQNFSDTSKAERELGWKASTDLHFGLMQTMEDLAKNME